MEMIISLNWTKTGHSAV